MSTPRGLRASPALRAAREARGWTRLQLAGLAGCSVSHLRHIEAGKFRCSPDLADRIRRALANGAPPDLKLRRDANRRAAAKFRAEGRTGWLATEAAADMYDQMIQRQEGA